MKSLLSDCKAAVLLTLVLVLLCCGAYPVAVWAGARVLFPRQAGGSLIVDSSGSVRGSTLIGQNFTEARYFHPRPSAAGNGYDAANSGGTNYGPTSAKLAAQVRDLAAAYRTANGLKSAEPIPADAVTASASGLDPQISVANARAQAARVAQARGRTLAAVQALIEKHTIGRDFGVLGEPGVNVLLLNLDLDQTAAGP